MDLMVDINKDLPKTAIDVARAEYRLLAVLNTNYQDEYVDDWILSLKKDIKSKL